MCVTERVRPNIVLVVLDTARADALEPYGAPAGATPVLADLAARGEARPAVFSTANWTMPSHASMFTGLLPREAGLARAPGGRPTGCRPLLEAQRHRLLPAVLAEAGYDTRGVSANVWITAGSGFDIGFDTFEEVTTTRNARLHDPSLRSRAGWLLEAVRARSDDGASAATEVLDRWLADRRAEASTRPFFWFVNLLECHSPYLPPRPWNRAGPLERMRIAAEAREHLTLMGIWGASAGARTVPAGALRRMREQYADSIRQLDDWIGRLVSRLDDAGVLDDTIIVITSDHGENLGESGLLGHAFWLDDRLVRVPFVWMGPVAPRPTAVTSIADLPGMLADAIGLVDHPWSGEAERTVAVATSDALAAADDERMERARAEYGLDDFAVWRMRTPSTAATDGRLKLVRDGDDDWLYDLDSDPLEQAPARVDGRVAALAGPAFAALRDAVDAAHLVSPSVRVTTTAPATRTRPDLEERMRMLGYL